MALRAGEVGYDQLHHFIATGFGTVPRSKPRFSTKADGLVGDEAWFLVIDDTALPKKGRHSVGVAPQYASSLGKTANCQSLVSLTLASREVPVMVGLRLFLPESWTDDPERMARAHVPKDRQTALTKPEIAIEEIDRVIAAGARFGCVLADSGYGSSGPFRQALSERGLLWAVGLSRRQNVYPADVALIFPVAKTGKPRKYHVPDQPPVAAEALLAGEKWQRVSWRRGTKGRLTCLFAARRVRVADGHKHRMLDNRVQCMPGDEVWLVGERRSTGEQKYYVSNLPADASLKMLAATIKARWVCEQAHQQLKEELGLDHFEGQILDRVTPTRLDDHDRLRLPPIPPPQSSGTEKKESGDHRHNRACRPSGKPSSTSSHGLHPGDARTVRNSSPTHANQICQSSARLRTH